MRSQVTFPVLKSAFSSRLPSPESCLMLFLLSAEGAQANVTLGMIRRLTSEIFSSFIQVDLKHMQLKIFFPASCLLLVFKQSNAI